MAAEIVSKLDYDFSNADKDKAMSYGVIARTIVLDEMVGRHIKEKSIEGSNAKFTWGVKKRKIAAAACAGIFL